MTETFIAKIIRGETKDTMGIVVPPAVVEALGNGRRPPVIIRFVKSGYSYRYTIASMGGQFLIGIAKEHRDPAGIKNQKTIEVTLTLDTTPREVDVPKDLANALSAAKVRTSFDAQSFTKRKEAVRLVESAKAEATRERRILKVVADLVAASS